VKSPFAVNVSNLTGKTGASLDVQLQGSLEGLSVTGSRVGVETPVSFQGEIRAIDGGLEAEGNVHTTWTGECRRCLSEASGEIEASVRELFERAPTEGETYGIDGDYVDFEPLVREAVMLDLPEAPLCKPDCAGLCPQCGANRNTTDCGHTSAVKDDRWAALDALRDE
jgi:uncharacterized protein